MAWLQFGMFLIKYRPGKNRSRFLSNFAPPEFEMVEEAVVDTLFLSPGKSVSEFLDPGLFEICHHPDAGQSVPLPFLHTYPGNMVIQPISESGFQQSTWVFWFILAGFFVLTLTRYYHEKRLKLFGLAIFKRSAALQIIRESPVHTHRSFIPLMAIYIISLTLLIYEAMEILSPGSSTGIGSLLLFAGFLGIYILFFLIKILAIWLISIIFKNPSTASEYIQTILLFNLVLGILLLPFLLVMTFALRDIILYISLGVAVILMGLRFLRGIAIGLSDTNFSLIHLFLYLCTLEILPIAVVAKFLSKYFFS